MKQRIYRSTVLIVLTSLVLLGTILTIGLYFVFAESYQAQLRSELNLLTAVMDNSSQPEKIFDLWVYKGGASRLTLIDSDGNVLRDTSADPERMENHSSRPEIIDALEKGFGTARRQSTTLGNMTFYAAQRLQNGQVLRLSGTQRSIFGVLIGALLCFCLAIPATLIASFAIAGRTTQSILKPIDALDLDHPADNEIYDEFTPLLSRLSAQNRRIESQMQELERRQREFSVITENMSEGLVILNARNEILTMNRSAREIFRAGDADYTGQYVLSMHRDTELMNVLRRAESGESAAELMRLNGRVLQLMASPVMENGSVQGILLLIPDVTDRVEAENNRREFSANVSHELKTPLTAILGYAELMRSGIVPPEDMQRFAGQIHDAARRLLQLVEDIIHLSRLDEGAPAQFESVDLQTAARAVCERFKPQANAAHLAFHLNTAPATIDAVPHMIDELMTNLIDNAIKYNRPGGSVTIEVMPDSCGARMVVRDTGIGIAPEHREKVFERFYRVDKSHSREIGGTGLGLSIVKHIAAYHHAHIEIESTPDVGTAIAVVFPFHQ